MENATLRVDQVFTPAFVVDLDVVENNCSRVRNYFTSKNIRFRPHMKTHKTLEVGALMTGGTKREVVVSTLSEAEFFADGGFDDIFYASPVIPNRIPRISQLMERLDQFHVMVDSDYGLQVLVDNPQPKKWSVFLAVDIGYGREGVRWDSQKLTDLVSMILQHGNAIELKAFYSHCGNSYDSRDEAAIRKIASQAVTNMSEAVKRVKEQTGWKGELWGIGSTPTCSKPPPNIDEMREVHPGNYVFNDYMQVLIGSCSYEDIAGKVVTSIVGHRREENLLLVDCGFLGLTTQTSEEMAQGFCFIEGHPSLKLAGMTQEIGKVTALEGQVDFDNYPVGSKLVFVPFHSCATAAMYPFYWTHRNGKILGKIQPCRGF